MNTYEVTWLLNNGTKETETYEAEKMEIHPTGPAVFYNMVEDTPTIKLVNPSEPAQPKIEIVGSVAGFTKIKKV